MQGSDQSIIFWEFAFIACWILLPLVPAVLIYLIFPNTQTKLAGPFSGLTLKSSGAFSAYFIVLLASYPVWSRQSQDLRTLMRPTWVVEGEVKVLNQQGREISYRGSNSKLDISLTPKLIDVTRNEFSITVPEVDNSVPRIEINYEGFGGTTIDPDRPTRGVDVDIDRASHHITIKTPLVIQEEACQGIDCPGT